MWRSEHRAPRVPRARRARHAPRVRLARRASRAPLGSRASRARRAGRGRAGIAVRALAAASIPALVLLAACAPSGTELPLPLRPEPVAWADTLPIPEPGENPDQRIVRLAVLEVPDALAGPLDPGGPEALNLTHFDDVVGSAWFEHRITTGELDPDDVFRGPLTDSGPAPTGPLTVVEGKSEGVSPGFEIEDARGVRYILKFDVAEYPHLASSAGIVGNRIMWAAGYHVPEDHLLVFDAERLRLDPGAEIETPDGERPMTMDDVREVLERTRPLPDGRYLAVASEYVPGAPKGWFLFHGTRDDDPNDHYAHEHRRELRGLRVISSWIHNTDVRAQNTLDVYVEPGYLRHYLIDFGTSLGSAGHRSKHPRGGREHQVDLWRVAARVLSLGLYSPAWEEEPPVDVRPEIGYLPAERFEPGDWTPNFPNPAFERMTLRDAYWGARIVGSFTDAHVRAAVEAGGLPTDFLADTLARVLEIRRDRLIRHWYARATPLEDPGLESGADGPVLTFRDLGIEHGAWTAEETTYRWELRDPVRDVAEDGRAPAADSGSPRQRIVVPLPDPPDADGTPTAGADALATLRVRADRPGVSPRPATVWLRWSGEVYEVVGLEH